MMTSLLLAAFVVASPKPAKSWEAMAARELESYLYRVSLGEQDRV